MGQKPIGRSTQCRLGLALTLIVIAVPALGAIEVSPGTDPTKQILRGGIVLQDGDTLEGEVVIEGDTITCVDTDCPDPPGASVFVLGDSYLFPGFIDAHNHVAYNVLPKWTPPRLYSNRSEWEASKAYSAFKASYNALKAKFFCEMVRWGEIAALMSGITAVQGTSPNQECFKGLVRNIETQNDLNLPAGHIRTSIVDIGNFTGTINWKQTRSFVVHVGEGVDEQSRLEFYILRAKGLLRSETAIIHGTAFGEEEFEEMGKVGAKLIWSPQSNLALYGQTTNIPLARKQGVEVSIGVDWNATGSDTIFDELRVAKQLDEELWGGTSLADEWTEMITINPARALAVDHLIGSVEAGKKADLTILHFRHDEPWQNLLQMHLADVEMVWIGGELLYGNAAVVEAVKPRGCEALIVQGSAKRLCTPVRPLMTALGKAFPWLVPLVR